MAIRLDTSRYERAHGRKPRQPRDYPVSPWAFQIDDDPRPVFIAAAYRDAVRQAKARARKRVIVLP